MGIEANWFPKSELSPVSCISLPSSTNENSARGDVIVLPANKSTGEFDHTGCVWSALAKSWLKVASSQTIGTAAVPNGQSCAPESLDLSMKPARRNITPKNHPGFDRITAS